MDLKLTAEEKATAQALRGKTIARVFFHPFDPNQDGSTTIKDKVTDPEIVFTDGSRLRFSVEETEIGEYGVALSLDERQDGSTHRRRDG
jgi:hypothetical protein